MTFASDKLGNLIHCLRFIACGCFLCQGCHIIHVLPIISSRSMLHLLVAARYFSWCFSLSRWDFKSMIFLFPSTCLLTDLHTGLSRLMKAFDLFSVQSALNVHTSTAPHSCKAHFHLYELVRAWKILTSHLVLCWGRGHSQTWLLFSSSCQAFLIAERAKPDTKCHLKPLRLIIYIDCFGWAYKRGRGLYLRGGGGCKRNKETTQCLGMRR